MMKSRMTSNRLKFTPDGGLALISDMEGGDLVVLDRATRLEIQRINMGRSPEGIVIAPGSWSADVALSDDNSVAVVDLKTFQVKNHIRTGSGPDGMAWVVRR